MPSEPVRDRSKEREAIQPEGFGWIQPLAERCLAIHEAIRRCQWKWKAELPEHIQRQQEARYTPQHQKDRSQGSKRLDAGERPDQSKRAGAKASAEAQQDLSGQEPHAQPDSWAQVAVDDNLRLPLSCILDCLIYNVLCLYFQLNSFKIKIY